ncbi:MAG: salt overly sensitive 1 [Trebouxia sp. A1-2]|nr:MAG: salt overly sensitive 1 [Trebouxia sp. A1-2]
MWLRFIYNQDVVEVTMTIVAALGCFIVANEILGVSGVLAVLCLGIWMAAFGSHHISRQVQQPLRIVWEELEFIANTLIFVLTGVIIAGNIYQSEHTVSATVQIQARDYGYAFLLWVVLIAIRAVIFAVCFPVLKYTGYSITLRKALVMVWAGLRGAVGLALSLFVLFDGQISDKSFRLLAFFFMGLIAAITIMIQGTTTGLLLQALGLTRRLSAKRTFLNNVMQKVERYGDAHAKMVQHSDVLGPPNWKDISSLASLNAKQLLTRYASVHTMQRPFPYWDPATDVELEASHRHITAERKTAQVRQETRARLLRAVQQTYKDVFERAHIAPAHMYRLRKSADRALDHTDQPVCDWKYLDESCQLPAWLHWLQRLKGLPFMAAFCRQQLFSYLEHSASVMVAFHYAHTDAAQSMLHFDLLLEEDLQPQEHDTGAQAAAGLHAIDTAEAAKAKIIQEVIQESKHQLRTAERYLHALRMAYPEVMASIRTKQVAQEMLLVKEAYVHELKASGLMDEAEVEEVIHLVDRQKKRLHFAGSLMHVQPASKELRQMLLFQGLNDQDFAKVTSDATLHLFPAGTIIHPNPASKGSLLFILRGAVALQKATPSDAPQTPAVAQQASAQLRHSQQTTSSPGAAHVTPDQSPLPLPLQDAADDHQSAGFRGSAPAAMHLPDKQAGISPQVAQSDSQAADAQQWELVEDISNKAKLVDSGSAQPIMPMPDNTGRSSEVLRVTTGQSQASSNCTTSSIPANISHTSGMVDTVRGQSTSSQQQCLVDSAGGQSGLGNSAGGQSGLLDSAGGQSGRQYMAAEQRPAPISDPLTHKHEQTAQKDVLDARGCAFGLPELMLGEPLTARVAAKTAVEAYEVPWLLLQSLTEQSQAMLVRVLQLCAAHVALLHGGPLLEQLTWMQLQNAFRKAKLQIVQEDQKICPKGLCFLFSGQLQTADDFSKPGDATPGPVPASSGTHQPSTNNSQASGTKPHEQQTVPQETVMPLRGAALGSVAHPNASGDLSDDTEHSVAVRTSRVLQGPAAFESDGTNATCLQDAQIFHLPSELLQAVRRQQQQQQQGEPAPLDIDNSVSASPTVSLAQQVTGDIGGTAGSNAADTGHWGKKLHEPSPFLSHDLWSKLGENS